MNQLEQFGRLLARIHTRDSKSLTVSIIVHIFFVASAGTTFAGQAKEIDPLEVMRARGCIACHIIPGIPEAQGKLGPTLNGLSKRKRIVARTLTNNDKNMRRWLKNPKDVNSGTMMPNVGLTDEEIDSLIEYFSSL